MNKQDSKRVEQTQRQAHEEAAGMRLSDSFFEFNNINPDEIVKAVAK